MWLSLRVLSLHLLHPNLELWFASQQTKTQLAWPGFTFSRYVVKFPLYRQKLLRWSLSEGRWSLPASVYLAARSINILPLAGGDYFSNTRGRQIFEKLALSEKRSGSVHWRKIGKCRWDFLWLRSRNTLMMKPKQGKGGGKSQVKGRGLMWKQRLPEGQLYFLSVRSSKTKLFGGWCHYLHDKYFLYSD